MSFASWVSNETSNLIKRKQTLQKALQKQANENRQRRLEALKGNILLALETDQFNFENTVFPGGKFSDIQNSFKRIKKTTQIPAEMFLEIEIGTTDLEKAGLLNIFAQPVFTSTDYQSKPELKSPMKIENVHFTQSETKSALENLDVAKAKSPDGLGILPHRKLSNSLCKSLSLVFNTIANKYTYPIAWKTSEFLSFFKDRDKQNVANYLFISLLSCTSKLQETLIFGKLYFEVIKDIIAPEQYGFRKNRSYIRQMIMCMTEIFDNLDSTTLATMYLGFEKAFDKVSHGKLLEKLTNADIRGGVLEPISSYRKGKKTES